MAPDGTSDTTPDGAPDVVLASTSAARAAALHRLRISFESADPAVDEAPEPGEAPAALALRLATAKAGAVAASLDSNTLVIGADQVAWFDGFQLPKPSTLAEAVSQLQRINGKSVTFHTALAVQKGDTLKRACVPTEVTLRVLSDTQLNHYVRLDQPLYCAGAFKVECAGIGLFSAIDSADPSALEGLPLLSLVDILQEFGYALFDDTPA